MLGAARAPAAGREAARARAGRKRCRRHGRRARRRKRLLWSLEGTREICQMCPDCKYADLLAVRSSGTQLRTRCQRMKIKGLQSPGCWSSKEQEQDEYDLHEKPWQEYVLGKSWSREGKKLFSCSPKVEQPVSKCLVKYFDLT
ncbi:hypothetical protein AV530_014644 [Patagioenas fasciata monilis]|uniref:Uncharacterized protein n=1 Tax=Patagioenas fasciata monilis TaxID=372326 RepID=A0A1V4KAY7_PATFA|nr:hypothetical protein AV530_014644 [Patagioenas fasciata monilis]